MKKYISYLLTLALLVPAFVSCTQERDFLSRKQKTHTVHFATSEPATRTGLSIEENMVKPDWRKTDLEIIHFFEIDATNAAAPGTADEINLSDDNRTAHFKAAISKDITIIVSPSEGENGSKGAKSAGVSPFTFAAVVAQMPDKNAYTFVIPSEQHPDAETLKDPNAEFLVGYSRKSYADQYDYDDVVVDLYFDRVAALGRLAISGFVGTGEKVKSVTITATGGMTGKATYPGDFTLGDKNKVNFTKVDEPLVLKYGENGVAAPEDAFYAYFVAAPGEASITSIEVLTDQYKYTKTIEGGKVFNFTDTQLLNIDFALSEDIAESVTEDNNTWYKASVLEAGYDYLIVSGGQALKNNNGETAAIAVDPQDGIITFEGDVDPAIIWKSAAYTGAGLEEFGHFTFSNGAKYLYRYSETTTQIVSIGDLPDNVTKHYVWDYDGTYLYHVSSASENRLYYCWYDGGWKTSNTGQMATALYTTRAPQTISFAAPGPFEYDLDDPTVDFEEPALGDHFGDVTYSSSDESIATVDSETGEVTFLKAGVVEITATAAGDDSHQAATASYMIVITSSQIQTWYKADELETGKVYMIVSNANALRLNGTSLATVSNTAFTGDSFQYEADDNLKWTAAVSSGSFTLKSGARFLSRGNNNYTIQTSSSSGASWSYDGDQYITTVNGSNTLYLYYSDSQGKWQTNTSGGSTHTAALYTTTPPLASRNLSFSDETVTHDLADGEDVTEPELTGDSLEGVTYASENEQIATVDANTGAVTLTGKTGSVIITASAPKTNTYKAESVSYTLIVKNGALGPKTYHKVTAASDLVVGARYLLVYEAGPFVFMPILEESGTSFSKSNNKLSVEISSNTITSAELGDYELALSKGYYLFVESANMYLYPYTADSGRTTAINAEVTPEHALTITISSGNTKIENGGNYLNYSTNSGGRFSSTASSTLNVSVYKLDDGTTPPTPEKQERNLSFGTESFSCTLGQSATFPTLSGVTDGVTYSSSNESVATVNTSGVVTVNAAGTTIIKAEAPESDTYLAGSAQYTLTVSSGPSEAKYYVLVTSEPASWNGKYLIVNTAADGTGSAMNGTGTANVTISGGKILSTSTIDGYALTVTSAGEVHPNQTSSSQGLIAYDIKFSDGDWLYWYSSKYKQTTENQSTRHNKCTLFYDNGGVRLMSAGYNVNLNGESISDPSKNYLYYQTSGSYTMSSNHASDRVQLYKLEDGSTPGGGDDPGDDPTPSYTKVTSITSGATYLIVSADADNYNGADGTKAFTGDQNGTAATVNNAAGVITGDYTAYEFVISASGSDYTLLGPNGYVTGNANSGSRYIQVSSTAGTMSLSMADDFTGTDGQVADAFYFYYTKTSGTSTSKEVLYFNADKAFKVGGTGRKYGVYLYKKVENP